MKSKEIGFNISEAERRGAGISGAFPAETSTPGTACGPFDWAQDRLIPAYDGENGMSPRSNENRRKV